MRPDQIEIDDFDIKFAEKYLLPANCHFDDERKTFIKHLETCDLHAVPGSGKTTALLAKLLILETFLPFDDGAGILVISHTNSAIDEIRNKLANICPKLFAYPNFIGTIQSFVDKFLAIPCYLQYVRKKPIRIDEEIYHEHLSKYYLSQKAKAWLNRKHDPNGFISKIRLDTELRLIPELGKTFEEFELKDQNSKTYKALQKMKLDLLNNGWLHFDDAYLLADIYLNKFSLIKKILCKRFQFVFVDEMQDMDKHQHDFLEKLFFDNGNVESVFQRIGDRNQAIFDGEVRLENIWQNRTNSLKLNGSNRLTSKNAEAVKYFGLDFLEIEGRNKNENQSEIDIKPHIIVFDDSNKLQVIEKFADLIKKFQDENIISLNPKYPFKAICWRKEVDGDNKIALSDYFDFKVDKHKPKIDYNCLTDYIMNCTVKTKEYREIRKNIISALLKILRLENIQTSDGRNYTETKLITYIKEKDKQLNLLETFSKKMFQWSTGIIKRKYQEVIGEIRNYLPEFLSLFLPGKTVDKSSNFVNAESVNVPQASASSNNKYENVFIKGDIKIEVATVHSAKGQTHTATLYLESFYDKGHGHYESERLAKQFKGNLIAVNEIKVVKQSARMVYVGFSRPTHLLCFAVHKERFDANLNDVDRNKWEIVELQ
jgi:hypothetical protein